MPTPLQLLFFLFLLYACTRRSAGDEEKHDDEAQKLTPSVTAQLQGNWEKLTQWPSGQWVIFRPCDADNLSMTVTNDSLVIGWGQDASFATIEHIEYNEVSNRYALTVHDPDSDEPLVYFLEWENEEHTLARWWLWGPDQTSEILARVDILGRYQEFVQPCHECWDDCQE
jgi:hypothetical protein